MSKTYSNSYRPDIDGLRALAIVPVVLFHAQMGCPGGFVGVDVFFVISGFLIASLILKELEAGTFSLIQFWERRIRRILPALALVVVATLIAGWFIYLPDDFASLGQSAIAQAVLGSNFFFWKHEGYFAPGSDTKPLLHTWSLAVEEQFYLLFPLLLMWLARRSRGALFRVMAVLAGLSLLVSVIDTYSFQRAAFYLLPMRAWELLVGALLAVRRGSLDMQPVVKESAGWLGLGLIAWPVFFYDANTRFPGLAAVPPCLGAALIIFSSETKLSLVGRMLSFPPVVFIGLVSYSFYLWHWPMLVFARYPTVGLPSGEIRGALLLASFGLACLSWRFVETPFRRRQWLRERPQVFTFAGTVMVLLLALGILVNVEDGFPARLSAEALKYAAYHKHRPVHNDDVNLARAQAGQFTELGTANTNGPVEVLLWGDSHARVLITMLRELCDQHSVRGVAAVHSATAPVLSYVGRTSASLGKDAPAVADAVVTFARQQKIKNIIIAGYWNTYQITDTFKSNLLATVRVALASGARVYVVKDVPIPGFDVPRWCAITVMHHGDLEQLGETPATYHRADDKLDATFQQISALGATVLDPSSYFLNRNGLYGVFLNGEVLYTDDNHLTVEGSRLLIPLFETIFHPVFHTQSDGGTAARAF